MVVVLCVFVVLLGFGVVVGDEMGILVVEPTEVEDVFPGTGQSPVSAGTAFAPLPMGTSLEPQEAALARWIFMLSWS